MAKCKVEFKINANTTNEEVYVCGNVAEFGSWEAKKAFKLKYDTVAQAFVGSKMIEVGTQVSYKVLETKTWDNVEVNEYFGDVQNHEFTAAKGHKENVTVVNFKK